MSNKVAKNSATRSTRPAAEQPSLYAADGSRKYLNLAERRRALAAADRLRGDKALFALTLAWTGARVSEVLSLTPSSFQTDFGVVAITTLKRRRHCVREVPLPPQLIERLEGHFGLSGLQGDPLRNGRPLWPWCRSTGWRLIKSIMSDANIVGRAACPRGFRHSFGVGALHAQVPLTLLQRWLGHARLSSTAIYADASGPEERAIADRYWRLGA